MARILYVITRSIMGGAQTHVLELAKSFKDIHQVSVAVGAPGFLTDKLAEIGVECHVVPELTRQISPVRDVKCVFALKRLIGELQPDIVHAHSTKAGTVARLAARLARVRSAYSVHGWTFGPGSSLVQGAVSWLFEGISGLVSDVIIFCTRHDRDFGRRRLPIGRRELVVVPYGVDAEAPQSSPGDPVDRPVVMMVARFSNQKDQPTLIRAAGLLKDLDYRLVFVGDGPHYERDQALAAQLGMEGTVEFLGTRRDLNELFTTAHVFVLCTHYEGLPLSIMEAMRAGLPIVASDVSGVSEEVEDGESGFLVGHRDHEAVAAKLRLLITDPALRRRMGERSLQKFREEFTREIMVRRMADVYDGMVAAGGRKP